MNYFIGGFANVEVTTSRNVKYFFMTYNNAIRLLNSWRQALVSLNTRSQQPGYPTPGYPIPGYPQAPVPSNFPLQSSQPPAMYGHPMINQTDRIMTLRSNTGTVVGIDYFEILEIRFEPEQDMKGQTTHWDFIDAPSLYMNFRVQESTQKAPEINDIDLVNDVAAFIESGAQVTFYYELSISGREKLSCMPKKTSTISSGAETSLVYKNGFFMNVCNKQIWIDLDDVKSVAIVVTANGINYNRKVDDLPNITGTLLFQCLKEISEHPKY